MATTSTPKDPARDGLTGLLSRETFDAVLVEECQRAQRDQTPLSLILIDLDHFKVYVESHTRRQVDQCLKKIGNAMSGALFRPTDIAARYDDDQFAILLPTVGENGARVVAARVRNTVNGLGIKHAGGEGGIVTVSIGCAGLAPPQTCQSSQLVELAAEALQQAKRVGRDCIVSQDWIS